MSRGEAAQNCCSQRCSVHVCGPDAGVCRAGFIVPNATQKLRSEDWESDELSWGYPSKQKDFQDSLNKEKYKLKTTFHLNIRLSKYSLSFRKLAALHNHYKSSS